MYIYIYKFVLDVYQKYFTFSKSKNMGHSNQQKKQFKFKFNWLSICLDFLSVVKP